MNIINAVRLHDSDNCATLTSPAEAGDTICFSENETDKTVAARAGIPAWHKIAVAPAPRGGAIYKYGAVIGVALENIEPGDHVHVHNTRSPG